jgi:hypothetical protein
MQTFRVVAVGVLAASFVAWSSSCSSGGGKPPPNPTTPVTVSITPSPQTQTVQVPQGSGPVTGTVTVPPVTPVPANATGNLTVSFLSGTNVAFARAAPQESQSFARQRDSDATLPGGPYIFEMTITAPFDFTLASVPAFTLDLGATNGSSASYVLVVENGASPTYQFTATAQISSIAFPAAQPSLTVTAGTVLTFGIALASNVPAAATVTSFTASPSSVPVAGGSVTLAWNVTGATALSIDNGVGSVTPVTTGSVTVNVAATTPFTLTATNANALTTTTADVCVAGPVTAVVTAPTSYTQCTDPFLTSIMMTNGSCAVVTITIIGFVSTMSGVGICNYSGPEDYTSANADLPFSVPPGTTKTVFDLTNGELDCCAAQPCSISLDCNDTLEWTLMTNIGPISALSEPFTVNVSNCDFATCQ